MPRSKQFSCALVRLSIAQMSSFSVSRLFPNSADQFYDILHCAIIDLQQVNESLIFIIRTNIKVIPFFGCQSLTMSRSPRNHCLSDKLSHPSPMFQRLCKSTVKNHASKCLWFSTMVKSWRIDWFEYNRSKYGNRIDNL